jgi:hypothetical protein
MFTRAPDEELRAHFEYMITHSDIPAAIQARRMMGAHSTSEAIQLLKQATTRDNNEANSDDNSNEAGPPEELLSFESTSALEYVGYSVQRGDWNGDGFDDVAFGGMGYTPRTDLPQTGAVYIHFGSNKTMIDGQVPLPSYVLQSNLTYARFGWALTTIDFNDDGIDDLVVSAPTSGWNWTQISAQPDFRYYGIVLCAHRGSAQ